MRKSTFFLAGVIGLSAWAVPTEPDVIELPANFDAWNLNFKLPLQKLPASEAPAVTKARPVRPIHMRNIRKEESAAKEYFVAAQTYHKDYVFRYEGGAITTYNIDIRVDGDKVTISRLFNLEAQSTDWSVGVDYDIIGTYDATSNTITIPTSSNFEDVPIMDKMFKDCSSLTSLDLSSFSEEPNLYRPCSHRHR